MRQSRNRPIVTLNTPSKKTTSVMLVVAIAFIAANLRAPFTSIGPLVSLIRDDLHISNTLAGMITTLPLFAFALFSPLVPGVARRFGSEWVLFWSGILLTVGILLRSWFGVLGLFLGTAILGLSISTGNVLIPSFIKKKFPQHIGGMTGIYSVSMNAFGALASGISVPIAVGLSLGWAETLRLWVFLGLMAVVLWIPQLRKKKRQPAAVAKIAAANVNADALAPQKEADAIGRARDPVMPRVLVWKSPLAWQITVYMGLQSMVFYCMIAWLPDILIQQGVNSGMAGWMLSLMQLALIPMNFVGSVLAGRTASQRALVTVGSACAITGLLGLLFGGGSGFAFVWIIILGMGGGFTFSLSIMFFSLRTKNADEAARLSGMAQSIGYLLAAFGPMFFGCLHDATGNWVLPILILTGIAVLCWIVGLGASRNQFVGAAAKR